MKIRPPSVRPPDSDTSQTLPRRGLLAAAAAFVAGLVAKLSETPLSAGVDGDVVLGATNTEATPTSITNTMTSFGAALFLTANGGTGNRGLSSQGSGFGVFGTTGNIAGMAGGAGVYGESDRANSYGVWGNSITGEGVHATSDSNAGLFAESRTGNPIFAQVSPDSTTNNIAIYGLNLSSFAGPGPGAGGFGIYGLCGKGHGLVGATAAPGAAALVGASNGVVGAYAAALYGPVIVGGDFTVAGGTKSAAVPHPDGSHRRLYCMESPESWFEDFGTSALECGRAEVKIDPDFAALVDLEAYHVFLTEYDDHRALYVTGRTPAGFTVHAKDGTGAGSFSWRVVAKRKDIKAERLATVTIPPAPILPPVPDMSSPPPPRVHR
jgi:hypothetical protein